MGCGRGGCTWWQGSGETEARVPMFAVSFRAKRGISGAWRDGPLRNAPEIPRLARNDNLYSTLVAGRPSLVAPYLPTRFASIVHQSRTHVFPSSTLRSARQRKLVSVMAVY